MMMHERPKMLIRKVWGFILPFFLHSQLRFHHLVSKMKML